MDEQYQAKNTFGSTRAVKQYPIIHLFIHFSYPPLTPNYGGWIEGAGAFESQSRQRNTPWTDIKPITYMLSNHLEPPINLLSMFMVWEETKWYRQGESMERCFCC